jgi:hypothetical protein
MMDAKDLKRAQSEYEAWMRLDEAQLALSQTKDKDKVTLFLPDPTGQWGSKQFGLTVDRQDAIRMIRQAMSSMADRLRTLGVHRIWPTDPPEEEDKPAAEAEGQAQ